MCGLAGFARNTQSAKGRKQARDILTDMLKNIEHRGHHATGVAALGGANDFLWKCAQSISTLCKNGVWERETSEGVANDAAIVIGHVRYATQNNAHEDRAAHPFRIGRVVGAHNGIIGNWRQIASRYPKEDTDKWNVDSEAAFYLLDRHDDAETALKQLEGNWALTWVKDGMLHMARYNNPIVCAYVARWRTMFWCSELTPMMAALKRAGVRAKDVDVWTPMERVLYTFDTALFDKDSTERKARRLNDCGRPRGGSTAIVRSGSKSISSSRDVPPFHEWREQRELELARTNPRKKKRSSGSERTLGDYFAQLESQLSKLADRCEEMEGILEGQQAEIRYLLDVCADAGLLDAPTIDSLDQPPF